MFYNPYENITKEGMKWLKANFHIHAGVELKDVCGELPMKEVVKAYKQAGYDVIAITNHNMYISYDTQHHDIALLDGYEYTHKQHMIIIGTTINENPGKQKILDMANSQADTFLGEKPFNEVADYQKVINDALDKGAFVILCHPNWLYRESFPFEEMKRLDGYTGIEILNTGVYNVTNWGAGYALATDLWDRLLTYGKVVYGFGNDDLHYWCDIDRVCNKIYVKSGDYADIKEAVNAGRFYVSTGIELEHLFLDGNKISVKAKLAIPSYIDNFDYRFIGSEGKVLYQASGIDAEYMIEPSEKYVRIEVIGDNGEKMYLQPLLNKKFFRM